MYQNNLSPRWCVIMNFQFFFVSVSTFLILFFFSFVSLHVFFFCCIFGFFPTLLTPLPCGYLLLHFMPETQNKCCWTCCYTPFCCYCYYFLYLIFLFFVFQLLLMLVVFVVSMYQILVLLLLAVMLFTLTKK